MTSSAVRVEALTDPPDPALIERVSELLTSGGVAVLPTDTVYGLSAAAESEKGLRRVFEIKGRKTDAALPVFVGDLQQARTVAKFDAIAEKIARKYWPGPLTLVLERRPGIGWDLGGDPKTIGLRWPKSRFLTELCLRTGPITATSANISGMPETKSVNEAIEAFGGKVDLYVDGGPAASNSPSTVLRLIGDREILRAGAIPPEEILASLK